MYMFWYTWIGGTCIFPVILLGWETFMRVCLTSPKMSKEIFKQVRSEYIHLNLV